jgi:hypothetical protein
VPEQHPAAARLRALADDDFDRVGSTKVIRVHPVTRREQLVDQHTRVLALLGRHPAVAGGRRGPDLGGAAAQRLLGRAGQRAEAHARDRDRDVQMNRLARVPRTDHDVGRALLPVALERIARHRSAQEQQVVEVRDAALGAEPADVVHPLARRALDLGDHTPIEGGRFAQPRVPAIDHRRTGQGQ